MQKDLRELRKQNELLERQLHQQQELIENLSRKVSGLEAAREQPREPGAAASENLDTRGSPAMATGAAKASGPGKISLSGEGGFGLFHSESEGQYPNAEFRIDEAKLFLEASIWKTVYLFTELNVITREDPNDNMRVGELYLDFENLSHWWHQERQLNLRAGRFYIPFGEEYQVRYAIDNPLVSHSLSDIWGVDEGLEVYGSLGKFRYVAAVQNGGHPSLHDYDADKAITLYLGYDPTAWLHMSVSAMRTGALSVSGDKYSEVWFGNGLLRSLGSTNTTTFQANLAEADVQVRWRRGHLKGAGGFLRYDDNDPTQNNQRDVYFYYVEAVQNLTTRLYAALRWSEIFAKKGFPIVGHGEYQDYFYNELSTELWQLTLGLGYRLSDNLILKAEYSFEQGKELSGEPRNHENQVAAEVVFRF